MMRQKSNVFSAIFEKGVISLHGYLLVLQVLLVPGVLAYRLYHPALTVKKFLVYKVETREDRS